MKFYDITRELRSAPLYPGAIQTEVQAVARIQSGMLYNESNLLLSAHAATHCDAYSHFIEGALDIAQMPLEHYIGACHVLSFPQNAIVDTPYLIQYMPRGVRRLLLKGGGNTYLTPAAAQFLIDSSVITLGTDALSVAPPDNEAGVHVPLLSAGVAIIEQLELSQVPDGLYTLFAPPLKIAGCEGAPCRAILIQVPDTPLVP